MKRPKTTSEIKTFNGGGGDYILIVVVFLLFLTCASAQTYTNLSIGTTEKKANATTTFQVGVRYQPSILGVKASFNQTDGGDFHTFDSYTLSATYEPIEHVYFNLGYRYDNGRGWGDNRQGVNVGINGLIPIEGLTKIIVSVDHTTTGLTNVMVGLQLRMKLSNNKNKRFF